MKHEKDLLEKAKTREEFGVMLADDINSKFSNVLQSPAEVKSDGLLLQFNDGSRLELHYPNKKEYSFNFLKGGKKLFIIDTAPIHNGLETFPNHVHDFEGKLIKDEITNINNEPVENIKNFLKFFGYIKNE
ncbi:MAG: toxin-antitoxin system TumE family protein [bacterium]